MALFMAFIVCAEDIIWDESDAFKANLPDHESYSPFDILEDQKRYEKEAEQKPSFNLSDETAEEAYEVLGTEIVQSKDYISTDGGAYHRYADMILINKITAKSKIVKVAVGDNEYFGNIEIFVEKCWFNEDLYKPSHKILLKVTQHKLDEDPNEIYHGWLVSSNIPICDMQSPTYEVIAMRCYD
jgi:hypothetical protein